MIEALTTN